MVASRSFDKLPVLEVGDHLSLYEFERRYYAMPDLKKAELIEASCFSTDGATSSIAGPART